MSMFLILFAVLVCCGIAFGEEELQSSIFSLPRGDGSNLVLPGGSGIRVAEWEKFLFVLLSEEGKVYYTRKDGLGGLREIASIADVGSGYGQFTSLAVVEDTLVLSGSNISTNIGVEQLTAPTFVKGADLSGLPLTVAAQFSATTKDVIFNEIDVSFNTVLGEPVFDVASGNTSVFYAVDVTANQLVSYSTEDSTVTEVLLSQPPTTGNVFGRDLAHWRGSLRLVHPVEEHEFIFFTEVGTEMLTDTTPPKTVKTGLVYVLKVDALAGDNAAGITRTWLIADQHNAHYALASQSSWLQLSMIPNSDNVPVLAVFGARGSVEASAQSSNRGTVVVLGYDGGSGAATVDGIMQGTGGLVFGDRTIDGGTGLTYFVKSGVLGLKFDETFCFYECADTTEDDPAYGDLRTDLSLSADMTGNLERDHNFIDTRATDRTHSEALPLAVSFDSGLLFEHSQGVLDEDSDVAPEYLYVLSENNKAIVQRDFLGQAEDFYRFHDDLSMERVVASPTHVFVSTTRLRTPQFNFVSAIIAIEIAAASDVAAKVVFEGETYDSDTNGIPPELAVTENGLIFTFLTDVQGIYILPDARPPAPRVVIELDANEFRFVAIAWDATNQRIFFAGNSHDEVHSVMLDGSAVTTFALQGFSYTGVVNGLAWDPYSCNLYTVNIDSGTASVSRALVPNSGCETSNPTASPTPPVESPSTSPIVPYTGEDSSTTVTTDEGPTSTTSTTTTRSATQGNTPSPTSTMPEDSSETQTTSFTRTTDNGGEDNDGSETDEDGLGGAPEDSGEPESSGLFGLTQPGGLLDGQEAWVEYAALGGAVFVLCLCLLCVAICYAARRKRRRRHGISGGKKNRGRKKMSRNVSTRNSVRVQGSRRHSKNLSTMAFGGTNLATAGAATESLQVPTATTHAQPPIYSNAFPTTDAGTQPFGTLPASSPAGGTVEYGALPGGTIEYGALPPNSTSGQESVMYATMDTVLATQ